MVRTQNARAGLQNAQIQRFSLIIAALIVVEACKVIERIKRRFRFEAEPFLSESQRSFQNRFRRVKITGQQEL